MIDPIHHTALLGASSAQARGCAVENAGYFFYGYWFSHSGV